MPPNKHALLSLLQSHIGEAKGISVNDLAYHLRTSERQVRLLVTELRMDGIAVSAHPRTGYFIAETAEELDRTCQFLRARAMQSLTIEAQLRRVPLPDLIGQLHLRT